MVACHGFSQEQDCSSLILKHDLLGVSLFKKG